MKKFLCVLMAAICIFSLAACGGNKDTGDASTNPNGNQNADSAESLIASEIVVADTDLYTIKVTKAYDNVTHEGESGFKFVATFVNKSKDVLVFNSTTTSINAVVVDIAGKTDSNEISILELEGNKTAENVEYFVSKEAVYSDNVFVKLDKVTELDAVFSVSKDEKIFAYETIHLTPYGEAAVEKYSREAKADEKVLLDNDYVTVTLVDSQKTDNLSDGNDTQESFVLYVVNKTDKLLWCSGSELSGDFLVAKGSAFENVSFLYNSKNKPAEFKTEYTVQTLDDISANKVTAEETITLA